MTIVARVHGQWGLRNLAAAAKIPPSKLVESINVAVWNVREFGRRAQDGGGAAFIGQFDLVGLVELRDDLSDFGCDAYLGEYGDVIYSDWMADDGGNRVAQAFQPVDRSITDWKARVTLTSHGRRFRARCGI